MKTIALVAENGAGKGLFVETMKKLLPGYRIVSVRFSDVLFDILDMLGKERSRDNIDSLVTALRHAFNDEGILNDAMRKRLADTEADIVILDGLRKEKEIPVVRERQGLLVYIVVDQRVADRVMVEKPFRPALIGIRDPRLVQRDPRLFQLVDHFGG